MISCDVSNKHPTLAPSVWFCGLLALMCLMSIPTSEANPIYKTYDAQGNVVFTDQPVDEAAAELLATPEVNVADPLPVAPQTPLQAPANTTLEEASSAPAPATVGLPTTPEAVPQTSTSSAQQGTLTTPDTVEQSAGIEPAAAQTTTLLTGDADAQGRVDAVLNPTNVTDELQSERVAIPVLPEGASAPVIGTARPSTESQVSVEWPKPDEVVLSTQSPIWVELKSEPSPLKNTGLKAEIWIDDKLAVSGDRPLLPLVLPKVGMHKLQVRLVDEQGNSVAESDSQLMDVRLGATQNR